MTSRLYPSGPVHGRVAHEIGRRIVSGAIAQGASLPRESELSAQFDVSRQAIREALKVLGAKGLIVSRRRAGTKVTPRGDWNLLDPDIVAWHPAGDQQAEFHRDLFELRSLIEPAAASFAAERAQPASIERIGAALVAMRAAIGESERFQKANVEFHDAVFAASGNALIERLNVILGPLLASAYSTLPKEYPIEDYKTAIAALEPVYEAIRGRNPKVAHDAMETHLARASVYVADLVARVAQEAAKRKAARTGDWDI